jgi:voltage-gated sodium channel
MESQSVMPAWQRAADRIAESSRFQNFIIAVILFNALIIGLETYESIRTRWEDALLYADRVLLGIFAVEIAIRITAAGFRPRFFRNGWNVFDTAVVVASFLPGLGSQSTVLRLIRLLRVTRLLRLMPDVRVLLDGLRRAAPPAVSLVGLTSLLCYLYAIVGWSIFHEKDPKHWGTLGESMLTLFTLLTLEGWNEIMADARAASPWGVVFILSFILVGTFVVLNLVIGVVITSLDEAYTQKRSDSEGKDLVEAIDDVRNALDALERKVAKTPGDPRMWE